MLGIGTGEALNEVASAPAASGPSSRSASPGCARPSTLMRRLWTEDRVDFEGDYYRTRRTRRSTTSPSSRSPSTSPPAVPLVARYAGRAGDGFICTSGKGVELYRDKLLPAVDEGLAQVRTHARRHRQDDRDQALLRPRPRAGAVDELPVLGAPVAHARAEARRSSDPLEMERLGDELSDEQVASRWIVTDDPEEVVSSVQPYVDLGFNHLVFHGPGARPVALPRRRSPTGSCPACESSAERDLLTTTREGRA